MGKQNKKRKRKKKNDKKNNQAKIMREKDDGWLGGGGSISSCISGCRYIVPAVFICLLRFINKEFLSVFHYSLPFPCLARSISFAKWQNYRAVIQSLLKTDNWFFVSNTSPLPLFFLQAITGDRKKKFCCFFFLCVGVIFF